MQEVERKNIVVGSLWMIGITLVLFFVPVINGLIGGFVGGRKVGSASRGVAAALLPAVVVGLGLWLLLGLFNMPFIGLIAGIATGVWIILSDIGLLVGAAIGGATAQPA